jgi:hypothetical protein
MTTKRLIGRDPNQVPLNAMLGRMAYLDPDYLPELNFSTAGRVIDPDPERDPFEALGPVFLAGIDDLESGDIAFTDAAINEANQPKAVTLRALNYWREYNTLISAAELSFEIGTAPNEIPVSGMLGRMAFVDEWCGYAKGGGSVTQATDKSTGVTLNTPCGQITLDDDELAANTAVAFTLTNSQIDPQDVVAVSIKSGATAGAYAVSTLDIASGSVKIVLRNLTAGSLSEAVVLNFVIIKSTTTA